jgi:putative DNA primase/helicase
VTSQGGSNAGARSDWSPLAGRDVIIWPDNDEPGQKYAATVRSCLRGIASSVRLVDVPRMNPDKPGWDAADWDGLGQIALVDETPRPALGSGPAPAFRMNNNGGMKAVTYNLVLLLGTPVLRDTLGWDMLADKPVWRSKPPFLQEHRAEIHDQDAAEFAFWAAEQISADFKTGQALEAIEVHAKRHPFHPVQDYLRRLRWDGTPRLDSWLEDVFGVPSTPYHQAVGAKFLIASVARAMSPGCQMDTMMVLMGKQGVGKTSAVRELLPDFSWYAETTESPANKDFYQSLRGKWIVEIGELHSFRNADWTKIKQMLSAKMDTYRASYAHFAKYYPRQCVFIGTTNDDTWNRDATGARRFWPVNVLDVNLDIVRHQRDQLWAEAFLRYTQGEDWWTVPVEEAAEVQDSVYETDPWQEPIRKWLATCGLPYVSSTTVMIDALQIEVSKVDLKGQRRVADCLKRLGYERIKKRVDGVPQWVFVRSP